MTNEIKICSNTRKLYLNNANSVYKLELTDEKFYSDAAPIFYDTYDIILGILIIKDVKYLVYVKDSTKVAFDVYLINRMNLMRLPFQESTNNESEIAKQIKLFVETNNFYYSLDRIKNDTFLWNSHMQSHFYNYKLTSTSNSDEGFDDWSDEIADFPLGYLYCGYCCSKNIGKFTMSVMSLISSSKIGPRFYCRGLNDSGDVSFFVNTDTQVLCENKVIYKKSVIRGSLPLFWYQDKNPLRSMTKYSREKDVSQIAFKKHFDVLNETYGNIFVINLLGSKDSESDLTKAYTELLEENKIPYFNFDMNKHIGNFENLKKMVFEKLSKLEKDYTFRVNCLDCMDRTNIAQYLINEYYLTRTPIVQDKSSIEVLGKLFAENGHALSNFYCGADSLKSELTTKGKRTVAGLLDDLYINASRLISGKFNDKTKQFIINTLLESAEDTNCEAKDSSLTCKDEQVFVFSWCINSTKFTNNIIIDIENELKTSFVVICLQKINMSYKKLLLDKKQEEREKWTKFFENKMRAVNYKLVSQNFHRDMGTLLFVSDSVLGEISDIKPLKFRQNILSGNISVVTNFVYRNKTFTINNSKLLINKDIYKGDSDTLSHIKKTHQSSDYIFMTGYFDSEMIISKPDYDFYIKNFDCEKLIMHDFLNCNMHLLSGYNEGQITFLPSGDLRKNEAIPKYATRIFMSPNVKTILYADLYCYDTGYRPVYGYYILQE